MLRGIQNGLSDLQLASNTLCGSQNIRFKPLQGLHTLGCSLNGISDFQIASKPLSSSQNGRYEPQQRPYPISGCLNQIYESYLLHTLR